jgi:hypothetical protein
MAIAGDIIISTERKVMVGKAYVLVDAVVDMAK